MMKRKSDIEYAIRVGNVRKAFNLPHEKSNSIKGNFVNIFRRKKKTSENFKVLNDISFDIKKGDFFGIVGRNGSGKSTLLKLLAGIYSQDAGDIQINGSLTPFIELGVGFNGELSGRENVFLNGALLGFNRKEMSAMYDDIVEFAELDRFMDQKLKNYSSGMLVRLAFSIAIKAHSDILLLDEVLAVGDEAFQRKCFKYFGQLRKEGKTVVLVTHDMSAVQRFCKHAILIDKGKIVLSGKPKDVAIRYSELNLEADGVDETEIKKVKTSQLGTGDAKITFELLDDKNKKRKSFNPNEMMTVRMKAEVKTRFIDPRFGIVIQGADGNFVFATNTQVENIKVKELAAGELYTIDFKLKNIFTDGTYTISGAVASNFDETVYDRVEDALTFATGGWQMKHAIVHPDHTIEIRFND